MEQTRKCYGRTDGQTKAISIIPHPLCGHLGFSIGLILAIFDLQVTPMLPTKFKVNKPRDSEEEAKTSFFKMAAMADILDFRSERF